MSNSGAVYLVGAGPGDAGLLTLRGAKLLASADVVVCDALVNSELLNIAPESAEIIFAGKRANLHAIPQDELNELLVDHAKSGKIVIRLKGGDPFLFGRGGEEAERLAASGIPFEVVPGVTSISAVPAYAGIPATHREHCSSITIFTGHENPDKPDSTIDWENVARESGTKIILMGIERLRAITERLIENGLTDKTPAALIRCGTTSQQETLTGTLADIADKAEQVKFDAPETKAVKSKNTNIKDLTVQGPLKPGEYIDAGSFKSFIDRCLREHGKEKQDQSVRHSNISKVRITVLASFSTDILSIAAKREFSLDDNFIEPESVETTQIRSRRERKKLTKYLEKFL